MTEEAFEIPSPLRGKAIVRTRCAPSAVPTLDVEGAATWQADRIARLTAVRDHYAAVDVSPLGPEWRPVTLEDFTSFDSLSPGDAAVAEATVDHHTLDRGSLIDAWVHLRGVPFAVEAFSRLCEICWTGVGATIRLQPSWVGAEPRASWEMALRLLDLVRSAPENTYREAVAVAARLREGDTTGVRSAIAAFLIHERPDWCDAEIARHAATRTLGRGIAARLLLSTVTTPQQVHSLGQLVDTWEWRTDLRAEATLITVGGSAAAAFLTHRTEVKRGDNRRKMNLLAQLPGDEAALILLDDVRQGRPDAQKALLAAGARFPQRTLRVVASAASDVQADLALRLLVRAHQETAQALASELEPNAGDRIQAVLAVPDVAGPPRATADRIPDVLATAPWLTPRTPAKPKIIKGLTPPPPRFSWLPGERESWLASMPPSWPAEYAAYEERDWQAIADGIRERKPVAFDPVGFVLLAPEDIVRPLLARGWQPVLGQLWAQRPYLARFEHDALPLLDQFAKERRVHLLAPATSPAITELMYAALRVGQTRGTAEQWFGRHGDEAVRCVVPDALGKTGRIRQKAAAILQTIADRGWSKPEDVARAAYGPQAADEVAALLRDRPGPVPKAMPTLPPWADPELGAEGLPPVLLEDGSAALPPAAVRILVQMLSISKPGAPYPPLAAVRAACDRTSLAAFARALFEAWRLVAFPADAGWVLTAQGILGDDTTVELLTPLIRVWPGEAAHARAVAGLDVLAAIGSDTALRRLHGLSLKGKFKALKDRAGERIRAVAEARGLDSGQLADRLIPDLGVSPHGVMTLDYGSRQFRITFSEVLGISVGDTSNRILKALPKPAAADDPELAPTAFARFSALKKELRTLAPEQLWRLELAMCRQRSWTPAEFSELLVAHPLMRHVTRGLVWAAHERDVLAGTFRVAEDLTYADIEDDAYVVPDGTHISVAHPAAIGPVVAKWTSVFDDYEILQPFSQLGRPIFELTDAEREAPVLDRFSGTHASISQLQMLEKHGWRRGAAFIDGGTIPHYSRALPDGNHLVLPLEPGIYAGNPHDSGPQALSRVWISPNENHYQVPPHDAVPFSRLDPVTASEIIRELTEATA